MIYQLNLTDHEMKKLNELRIKGKTIKIRQKANAIYLRAIGKTIPFVMSAAKLSNKTIISHVKKYIEKGMDYIFENNYKGNISELDKYETKILEDFKKAPPATIGEATARIEKLTGLKRSGTQVSVWLKKTNFLTKNQEVYQQKQIQRNKKNS